MMKFIFALLLVPSFLLAGTIGTTKDESGLMQKFVKIRDGRELYVDWAYAKPGKPTVVLLNGLTYSTVQWNRFTKQLVDQGVGVVRFDPMGMGQTLLQNVPVLADIKIEDQAQDLHDLIVALKLQTPVNLVGLSYGGGLELVYASLHPENVNKIIAMAPYTEPLQSQNEWIKSQIWYTRQVQPWNQATDDELYAYYFRQIVYSTYPMVEPVVLENPFKLEAIFRMGLGIRHFRANDIASKLPAHSLHLVIAGRDQYIPRGVLEDFWAHVPASVQASKLVIANSEHKIVEDVPKFAASWVMEILKDSQPVRGNTLFEADPYTGLVKFPGGEIQLTKEY